MKHVKGDLIKMAKNGQFDVIVHGCNCFHTMGGGIAAQVKKHFPAAYESDLKTGFKDAGKLGTYSMAKIPLEHVCMLSLSEQRGLTIDPKYIIVVNAYTQYDFGSYSNGCPTDYNAIRNVFRSIARDFNGLRVGIPAIGCGLGGGDWDKVSAIIEEECQNLDITYVSWQKTRDL